LLLLAVVWEAYKAVGPENGGKLLGAPLLPKTGDLFMPHVWEMLAGFGETTSGAGGQTAGAAVLAGAWYTFRLSLVGLLVGLVVGGGLAVLMTRLGVLERGLLPWLIISQTVPLIALAPLVASWGGRLEIWGLEWKKWMSASVIAAFLAFFPISVAALRGLSSPPPAAIELLDSYAASWRAGLFKVRLPAAVPYLVPGLRLAANAAVVGTIVAEISTGLKGGIGRLILEYMRQTTSDPARVYVAVFAAAALGLVMAGVVGLFDVALTRNRPKEASA
jgi:NitT/TauT family transport system permease protein